MTGTPDETPTNTFAPGGRRRHRKARVSRIGARRALVLAMAVPVASATLAGTSAFAADESTPQTQGVSVDDLAADDAQLVENLDERLADKRLGTDVSGIVLDADSDTALWDHNGSTALMPASNAKLATATTALTLLGANHEFTTKVVYGEGTLTLVGGGDRTLTSEDVAELAKTAADGLRAAGRTDVQVRVDDSLFADPSLAEGWNEGYYPTEIAPVRSLVVDGAAVQDTSIDAGKVFAKKLAAQGITVTGEVGRQTAKQSDVPVAQHKSAPLSDTVKQMLKTSDNNIAETLLRMTAVELGKPGTFEAGTALVRQVLSSYGISLDNFEMHDGSGPLPRRPHPGRDARAAPRRDHGVPRPGFDPGGTARRGRGRGQPRSGVGTLRRPQLPVRRRQGARQDRHAHRCRRPERCHADRRRRLADLLLHREQLDGRPERHQGRHGRPRRDRERLLGLTRRG
ncbi:D-alanyl-D-alanine carboxypeptidase/D-alanyl-D-alanine-endopeptidase (penicillin-binding protein 4) [Streptomyces ambofaciens]